ncbi:tumor necrosis factor receptor superfamily member 5 isoform X2 [Caretta caretta]|uniref:tumor necrosis factor receptor superfamily member 5 isoform X2 n=1 Tax=Caretta caretta TaxID=8467 RepID=UPI002095A02F|nr:tumor necrosis factor receptor superfamily member 5 isoform X2 [Caretta caretta]
MPPCRLLCLLLGGCLLTHWASGSDVNCTPEQYPHDGRCCRRCGPGDKLLSDCTASKNTDCGACEAGHFQSGWTKERHCTPHRSCDLNAGLLTRSPGDAKRDAVCECLQGMFCSSPACQTCLNVTKCKPGEGVARKADNFSDTACVPCEHGSFSNTSSASEPCRPWTRCETRGLVLKTTGTNLLDVACEPGRGRSPVLISIMAFTAACLLGLTVFCLYQKGPGAAGSRGACVAGTAPAASHGGVRGARRAPGLPGAGDPAGAPARGAGGRQGEPHLGAGEAVRPCRGEHLPPPAHTARAGLLRPAHSRAQPRGLCHGATRSPPPLPASAPQGHWQGQRDGAQHSREQSIHGRVQRVGWSGSSHPFPTTPVPFRGLICLAYPEFHLTEKRLACKVRHRNPRGSQRTSTEQWLTFSLYHIVLK